MKLVRACLGLVCLVGMAGCASTGANGPASGRDPQPEFQLQLKLAEAEDAKAQYAVGKYYSAARNGTGDLALAVDWYRKAADQKETKAETALGVCYLFGRGIEADYIAGIKWLEKARAQDDSARAYLLGLQILGCSFLTNDCGEPGPELRRMASHCNGVAQEFLGIALFEGRGLPKNTAEAVKWFRKSAEQGEPIAQALLAGAYFQGEGVPRHYINAVYWARNAAERGDDTGQMIFACCYQQGKGVRQNLAEAAKWFRHSAELGNENARLALGLMYRKGEGVVQDYVAAYKWLDRAAVRGNARAVTARAELTALMTERQLTEADAPPRRHLTRFDRKVIDAHEQRYDFSCIPSSVEMALKLLGRVPGSYYELQNAWKNKADGSFHNFDGKVIEGVTFKQDFTQAHNDQFPLAALFDAIDQELKAGRFVIVGLPSGGDSHNWLIYDEDVTSDFLAVSKGEKGRTLENNHVRRTITAMKGTDIGIYREGPSLTQSVEKSAAQQ